MIKETRISNDSSTSLNQADIILDQRHQQPVANTTKADLHKLALEMGSQLIAVKKQQEAIRKEWEIGQAAQRKYKALFENSPFGIFILSNDNTICEMNAAGASILGTEKSLLYKLNFNAFLTKESIANFNENIEKLFQKRNSTGFVMKLRKNDGSMVFVHIDAALCEDTDGYFLTVSRMPDHEVKGVTGKIKRDGFLQKTCDPMKAEGFSKFFESIINSSDAPIGVVDLSGKLIYINPAHERFFGRSFEEAISLNFRDHHPVESLNILNDKMMPALIRGKSWEGEIEAINKNGQRIQVWAHAGAVQDEEGQIEYLFCLMNDISAQKKAENDRLQLEMLKGEESERLRIAHDLHNHIGHIIIGLKIHIERTLALTTSFKHSEELENLLGKVIFALKEVRQVSSKLAEKDAGPWKFRQQLSTFLTDLESTCSIQILRKIDPLPDEISDSLKGSIIGILEETLTNVMKHTDANRIYIHIFIKKDRFFINIRDNGKGMDHSLAHQGSGLSFLKKEAEGIGGEITLKSVPGKFCMVKFNAPLETA